LTVLNTTGKTHGVSEAVDAPKEGLTLDQPDAGQRPGLATGSLGHGYLVDLGLAAAVVTALLEAASNGIVMRSVSARTLVGGSAAFAWIGFFGTVLLLLASAVLRRALPRSGRLLALVASFRSAVASRGAVRLHAEVAVGLLVAAVAALLYRVPLNLADDLQADADKVRLLVVAAGAIGIFSLLAERMLLPLGNALFERVASRFGLPLPKAPWAWFFVFVMAPLFAGLIAAVQLFGQQLGVWSLFLGFGVWLAAFRQLFLVSEAVRPRLPTAIRVLGRWGTRLPTWGLLSVGLWLLHSNAAIASASPLSASSVQLLQALSDLDRDGASSIFGGGDCAALDADVHPGAREVPGNAVDEDCDGADLVAASAVWRPSRTYSHALPQAAARHFNVVLVVVDSLRADHTSAHGYEHDTTPYFAQLARTGWLFEQAYSQATNTSLSMPSLASGLDPGSFDWKQGPNYPEPKEPRPTLQRALRDAGYYTVVSLNHRMNARIPSVKRDYESVLVTPKAADWNSADHSLANAVSAIDAAQDESRPLLLLLHLDGVHTPYVGGKGRALPAFRNADPKVVDYDRGIAQVDHTVRSLVGILKARGLWDETVFVLTADHGEEFGEHGGTLHSTTCHREAVHVPLLVRVPGQTGKRIATPVALVDVVPTLLELLALPLALPELDGQSLLVPALTPEFVEKDRPIFCTVYQLVTRKKDFFIRAVRRDGFALMHEFVGNQTSLFDLSTDPDEQRDLSKDEAYAERKRQLLDSVLASKSSNVLETRRVK
jgi:arylsulfatase A-like enzyme